MSKILVPSPGSSAWQQFLAEPDKQWRSGYSARTLACCWEDCDAIVGEMERGTMLLLLSCDERQKEYRQA